MTSNPVRLVAAEDAARTIVGHLAFLAEARPAGVPDVRNGNTIAALLAPWFSRRTVTDLAAAFAGTSVPWALLNNLTGRPESRRCSRMPGRSPMPSPFVSAKLRG